MIRILHITLALIICFLSIVAKAQFSATANPASITSINEAGKSVWNNTSFANAADNKMATTLLTGSANTASQLDAKSWGFQSTNTLLPNYIPSNAVINGISVTIKVKKELGGNVHTAKIRLLKAGSEIGDNRADKRNANWSTTNSNFTYGSITDKWNTSWSVSDITNSNFGVRIAPERKSEREVLAQIDNIQITVYYNLTTFYSKSSGDLSLNTTWGTNTDGSGTMPLSFVQPGQLFVIRNRSNVSLTKPLAITGANSALIVGSGSTITFTIPKDFPYSGNMEVANSASVIIESAITPNILSTGTNSTVTFENDLAQNISPVSFFNLTLNKKGVKTLNQSTAIENKLVINTDAILNNNGHDVVIEGSSVGITNHGIAMGAGTYAYELDNTSTNIAGKGTFQNLLINTDKKSGNNNRYVLLSEDTRITGNLTLHTGKLRNGNKLILEAGARMTVFNGELETAINAINYDVCYIIEKPITKRMANEMIGTVRNLIINGVEGAVVETNNTLHLTGNLHIEAARLDVTTANHNISIGGNLTGNGTINNRNNTFTFSGLALQTVAANSRYSFNNLTIANAVGVTFNAPTYIQKSLTLEEGIVYTSESAMMTIAPDATVTGFKRNRFISGPVAFAVTSKAVRTLVFPVGKGEFYKPITLNIAQKTTDTTYYTGEFILGTPKQRTLTEGIAGFVATDRYYTVHCSNNNNVDSATIALTYGVDDNLTNTENLAIVKSFGDTKWKNVKGKKQNEVAQGRNRTGTIVSDPFYSFSDFRLGESGSTTEQRTLPLKWGAFTAATQNDATLLKWETTEEVATKNFIVERSADAVNWKEIANVKSNNKEYNNYAVTDASPLTVNYYRVKQIDLDGKFTYSKTIQVKFTGTVKSNISVRPNPVLGSNFACAISDKELLSASTLTVSIINAAGHMAYNSKHKAESVLSINCSNLKPGYYIITIQNGKKMMTTNFIKK